MGESIRNDTAMVAWLRNMIKKTREVALHAWPAPWEINDEYHDVNVVADGKPIAHCDRDYGGGLNAEHIARHNPTDVIADCEAKLAILALHKIHAEPERWGVSHPHPSTGRTVYWCETCDDVNTGDVDHWLRDEPWCPTLQAMAYAYRHREGWQERWRP